VTQTSPAVAAEVPSIPAAGRKFAHEELPAGPRLPRALQTVLWQRNPDRFLKRCRDRYGETFTMRIMGEGDWVIVSSPEAVKEIFRGDPEKLYAGEANAILGPILGANSVLLLDGKRHLRERRLLLPPFHGERMQSYGELMAGIAREEIDTWPVGTPFAAQPHMQSLTLEIILQAVFGLREGERLGRIRNALRRILDDATSKLTLLTLVALGPQRFSRLRKVRETLGAADRLLFDEIDERRRSGDLSERADILSLLLQATDENGEPLSDRELRDELMTLLVAGHETTATALSWVLERLTREPERMRRLVAEIDAGESTDYLDAVVLETLRLRPVLPVVVRRVKGPMTIGGVDLPEGATVAPGISLVHSRPEIYPDPESFRPERFLEQPPGTYTFIPFGGGVRRCLGAAFAQYEMRIVLRELLATHTVIADGDPAGEGVLRRAITSAPAKGGRIVVRRRQPPRTAAVAEPATATA
jgi:cytochrome P450